MVNCTKTEICGLRNAEILMEKNMQKIYRKFTGIDEAREWGKKIIHIGYRGISLVEG